MAASLPGELEVNLYDPAPCSRLAGFLFPRNTSPPARFRDEDKLASSFAYRLSEQQETRNKQPSLLKEKNKHSSC
jgi:hypothetical protein